MNLLKKSLITLTILILPLSMFAQSDSIDPTITKELCNNPLYENYSHIVIRHQQAIKDYNYNLQLFKAKQKLGDFPTPPTPVTPLDSRVRSIGLWYINNCLDIDQN